VTAEYWSAIGFLVFSLAFYIKCIQHVDRMMNNDSRHADLREDIDYGRMVAEAERYGYEGSRLQRYTSQRKN
jgi:hypothetical protein